MISKMSGNLGRKFFIKINSYLFRRRSNRFSKLNYGCQNVYRYISCQLIRDFQLISDVYVNRNFLQ